MIRSIPIWNRCVLLLLIAIAAYFQTWVDLWPYWETKDATYAHGTLIAVIVIWLVWRARPALVEIRPAANPKVLGLVAFLSALWLVAERANVFIVHVMLWPVLAFAMLWAGVGWRGASKLAFPLGFLYFAIPIWDYLKPPLQVVTSWVVGWLTGISGVPAIVDGPYITVPSGTIFIALDCSGAHFLAVALSVAVLAGAIRGDDFRTRCLILIVAAALSMVFNWLRILLIVYAYLNPTLKNGLETIGHFTFGWWVFALDLLVFGLVLRSMPSPNEAERVIEAVVTPAKGDGAAGFAGAVVAALMLPASSWALTHLLDAYPNTEPAHIVLGSGRPAPDLRWQPKFRGPAWEYRAAFVGANDRVVELYRNEYHEQSQDRELVSRGSQLFDAAQFRTSSSTVVPLNRDGDRSLGVNRVELVDLHGQQWIALYTYLVDGEPIADAWRALLGTALRSLYSHPTAGVLAVATLCVPDCAVASAALEEAFLQARDAYREQ